MQLGLDERSSVVDLGAGTGQFTLGVAPLCARVVAVDISPVMLDRLRAKVDASGISDVEIVQAGLLSYEHKGSPAEFAYSRWALHHLPDLWKVMALYRIRKLVRPDGVLRLSDIVYSFDPDEAADRIEHWCATLPVVGTTDGEWVRADLEEHVRDEHSTFTWLLEPMIERSGFGSSTPHTPPTASSLITWRERSDHRRHLPRATGCGAIPWDRSTRTGSRSR